MDDIQKFYTEWQERSRFIKGQLPIFNFFIIFALFLCGVSIALFFTVKTNTLIFFLLVGGMFFGSLFVCFFMIFTYFSLLKRAKYDDLFKNYLLLLEEIKENIPEACDKKYNKIFWDYANFIGIGIIVNKYEVTNRIINEFDVIKKLQSFRDTKDYHKDALEDLARKHTITGNLLLEEENKRVALRMTTNYRNIQAAST